MRRRPLVHLALAWMAGILLGRELGPGFPTCLLWLLVLLSLVASGVLLRARRAHWPELLLVLVAGLGAIAYLESQLPFERLYALVEQLDAVRGVVADFPDHRPERSAFVLKPQGWPGFLKVFYYHSSGEHLDVAYGDLLELRARFQAPGQLEGFDYREYLSTRDVWGVATLWSARGLKRLGTGRGHPLLRWGYRVRLALFALIDRHVPGPGSGLLKGLFTGERAYLEKEVEGSFRDAGVAHVLAVSGLHLGILIGLFWGLLKALRLTNTQVYLALIPPLLGYLAIVGFKVSLVRASLMFGFVALGWVIAERGWILRKWIDPLQGLSAAALVILSANPQALFDVGFQLSFAATAGILLALERALPRLEEWGERLRARWQVPASQWKRISLRCGWSLAVFLSITAAAQLAVAPILAHHFHRVYLVSLLANLAVVPLVTVALWLGVLLLLGAALHLEALAAVLGALEGRVLELLTSSVKHFADLPGAYLVLDRGLELAALVALPLLLSWATLKGLTMALPAIVTLGRHR